VGRAVAKSTIYLNKKNEKVGFVPLPTLRLLSFGLVSNINFGRFSVQCFGLVSNINFGRISVQRFGLVSNINFGRFSTYQKQGK
jgi:hypothetical protein